MTRLSPSRRRTKPDAAEAAIVRACNESGERIMVPGDLWHDRLRERLQIAETRARRLKQERVSRAQNDAKAEERAPRAMVGAPAIRVIRGDVELEERSFVENGRVIGRRRGDVVRDQLWRHWSRREILERQYQAGDRLQRRVEMSEVSVPSLLDFSRTAGNGGGRELALVMNGDRAVWATADVRRALQAVGPQLTTVLVWVVLEGRSAWEWAEQRGKPRNDGIAGLRLALDALADFYRIDAKGA